MSQNNDHSFTIDLMRTISFTTLAFMFGFFTILAFDPSLLPKDGLYEKNGISNIDKMTCTQLANYLIQNDYEQNNRYDTFYQHAKAVYDKEKCFQ